MREFCEIIHASTSLRYWGYSVQQTATAWTAGNAIQAYPRQRHRSRGSQRALTLHVSAHPSATRCTRVNNVSASEQNFPDKHESIRGAHPAGCIPRGVCATSKDARTRARAARKPVTLLQYTRGNRARRNTTVKIWDGGELTHGSLDRKGVRNTIRDTPPHI